ncbi:hypothetical protein [Butyrivibrio sp. LB2008]|uniref:hypothetical protein n=1 Tax=Butyrivibrio sp. LB2008 TaxID=1408305 RepID=UPI00047D7A44|nr:hypothetical protein [Butyrivibrio sp. LB2008]
MNSRERKYFIERMEEMGDIWEDEDVKRVYGRKSLEEALSDRMSDMQAFANIMGMVIKHD